LKHLGVFGQTMGYILGGRSECGHHIQWCWRELLLDQIVVTFVQDLVDVRFVLLPY
jgi:hypothetical protein